MFATREVAPPEQLERQHRRGRAQLVRDERREHQHARDERDADERVAPAEHRLLDQPERDPRQAERAQQRAGHVQRRPALPRIAGLGHVAPRQRQRDQHERDVDREHPAPRDRVDDLAADQRPGEVADAAPGGPGADRRAALGLGEDRDDDRERGRRQQRARDPLQRARDDQQLDGRRQRAEQRRDAEARHAEREHAPLAVDVGERAGHEDQRAEREQVGVGDPLLAREAAAELVRDRRQRDVDHGRVDRHDRGAEDRRDQCPALDVHPPGSYRRVSARSR